MSANSPSDSNEEVEMNVGSAQLGFQPPPVRSSPTPPSGRVSRLLSSQNLNKLQPGQLGRSLRL